MTIPHLAYSKLILISVNHDRNNYLSSHTTTINLITIHMNNSVAVTGLICHDRIRRIKFPLTIAKSLNQYFRRLRGPYQINIRTDFVIHSIFPFLICTIYRIGRAVTIIRVRHIQHLLHLGG